MLQIAADGDLPRNIDERAGSAEEAALKRPEDRVPLRVLLGRSEILGLAEAGTGA